jgi:hypothetical protein
MTQLKYAAAALIAVALISHAPAQAASIASSGGERKLFLKSAVEDAVTDRATLPVFEGVRNGQPVWYVVTESSNKDDARVRGVNFSQKLANARGSAAVQKATIVNGKVNFPASVDFSPQRAVTPGPTGFPPAQALPGSVGETGYSPLIELPGGIVINAPHIANATGQHDKLTALDLGARKATFQETEGFYKGKEIYYVSFDASDPGVAALEASTYAPALNAAPGLGSNRKDRSARSGIIPFVNGQTGANNANRQGLNSALLDGLDPLNVLQTDPGSGRYSPLWDVHATAWTAQAIADSANTVQDRFEDAEDLAEDGLVTGPDGAPWGAVGIIVNCPVISLEK